MVMFNRCVQIKMGQMEKYERERVSISPNKLNMQSFKENNVIFCDFIKCNSLHTHTHIYMEHTR